MTYFLVVALLTVFLIGFVAQVRNVAPGPGLVFILAVVMSVVTFSICARSAGVWNQIRSSVDIVGAGLLIVPVLTSMFAKKIEGPDSDDEAKARKNCS